MFCEDVNTASVRLSLLRSPNATLQSGVVDSGVPKATVPVLFSKVKVPSAALFV